MAWEYGSTTSVYKQIVGDDQNPLSVYLRVVFNDFIKSSGGLKININKLCIQISLGVNDTGVKVTWKDSDTQAHGGYLMLAIADNR